MDWSTDFSDIPEDELLLGLIYDEKHMPSEVYVIFQVQKLDFMENSNTLLFYEYLSGDEFDEIHAWKKLELTPIKLIEKIKKIKKENKYVVQ